MIVGEATLPYKKKNSFFLKGMGGTGHGPPPKYAGGLNE
jgi:hypothetical protein